MNKIRVEDNNDGTFTLLEPVEWFDDKTATTIIAPAGFPTDYASVPSKLQSFASKVGRGNRAAIIHDWLCHTRGIPRASAPVWCRLSSVEAARIFREIMAHDGVGFRERWRKWWGVRLFGPQWKGMRI